MIGIRISQSTERSSERSSRSSSTTTPASVVDDTALVPRDRGSTIRTLDDVREQVAQEIAINTKRQAKSVDGKDLRQIGIQNLLLNSTGVRIAVRLITSKSEDECFLEQVWSRTHHQILLHRHLFAVGTIAQTITPSFGTLIISGSNLDFVQRAVMLVSSKFIGRIASARNTEFRWTATIQDLGISPYDEDALWDVLFKAARPPMDPLFPPPGSKSIDEVLSEARAKLQRISATQAYNELKESQVGAPTFLVDIRPEAQREREGGIDGALIIERNVLEWRFDPRSESRLAIADRYDLRIIVFCQEGYTSR